MDLFRFPSGWRETTVLQHRLDAGRSAAPGFVHFLEILRIAAGEDHLPEFVTILPREAAVLFEPLVGVVIEHLRPEISVVTGGVSAAPNMAEVAGAVAGWNVADPKMRLLQRFRFKSIGLLRRRTWRKRMPLHVQLGRGQQLSDLVPFVERRRLLDLCHQFGGHWLPGFVMLRVVLEDRRIDSPMLVELRRKLHKVARDRSTRKTGIVGIREHAMQRVSKLVE